MQIKISLRECLFYWFPAYCAQEFTFYEFKEILELIFSFLSQIYAAQMRSLISAMLQHPVTFLVAAPGVEWEHRKVIAISNTQIRFGT